MNQSKEEQMEAYFINSSKFGAALWPFMRMFGKKNVC